MRKAKTLGEKQVEHLVASWAGELVGQSGEKMAEEMGNVRAGLKVGNLDVQLAVRRVDS